MIQVTKLNDTTFEVTVTAKSTTTHTVTVAPDYARKLTGDTCSAEHLVHRSFDFLLQREPNTSILRSFDLPVIARYFSEYERVIQGML
ncbi:MAG: hypothetical protein LBV44_06035 [Methylobacillus sp.]|jgi:hypothetical protein|nr:hypothetical protein [Methylobacillus sp.]